MTRKLLKLFARGIACLVSWPHVVVWLAITAIVAFASFLKWGCDDSDRTYRSIYKEELKRLELI